MVKPLIALLALLQDPLVALCRIYILGLSDASFPEQWNSYACERNAWHTFAMLVAVGSQQIQVERQVICLDLVLTLSG